MQTLERPPTAEYFDRDTRRYNDTVTWLAEVLPGNMRTPFEYRFDGHELYASDGSALGPIFDKSIEDARNLPAYEQRRRTIEKQEYADMIRMMQGDLPNTMVIVSDFPPELMSAQKDVGGYNVSRKQTMLRIITKAPEGTLRMVSQSLDGSNRMALEAICWQFGYVPASGELLGQRMYDNLNSQEQERLADLLTHVYDKNMQVQFGGNWYAGRPHNIRLNTYDFVCQQTDLLQAYLANTNGLTGGSMDFNLAAAMEARMLNKTPVSGMNIQFEGLAAHSIALAEMNGAGAAAIWEGKTYSGCGITAQNEQSADTAGSQLSRLGYGNLTDKAESETEKLIWKKGVCRIDGCPSRPGKTDVAQCSVCRGCQHHFDQGRDPSKMYKSVRQFQRAVTWFAIHNPNEAEKRKEKSWLN